MAPVLYGTAVHSDRLPLPIGADTVVVPEFACLVPNKPHVLENHVAGKALRLLFGRAIHERTVPELITISGLEEVHTPLHYSVLSGNASTAPRAVIALGVYPVNKRMFIYIKQHAMHRSGIAAVTPDFAHRVFGVCALT